MFHFHINTYGNEIIRSERDMILTIGDLQGRLMLSPRTIEARIA